MRTQNSNVLALERAVGQYIATRATPTARDFFLTNIYPPDPFTCILQSPLALPYKGFKRHDPHVLVNQVTYGTAAPHFMCYSLLSHAPRRPTASPPTPPAFPYFLFLLSNTHQRCGGGGFFVVVVCLFVSCCFFVAVSWQLNVSLSMS